MLRKLSSRQEALKKMPKNFPGLLHTSAKYEKNLPYGCEAIAKRKCGSGGVASPVHKHASLVGRLILLV